VTPASCRPRTRSRRARKSLTWPASVHRRPRVRETPVTNLPGARQRRGVRADLRIGRTAPTRREAPCRKSSRVILREPCSGGPI
jgi:hypothetical protein